MTGQLLTEVSAVVSPEREAGLVAAYRVLVAGPLPPSWALAMRAAVATSAWQTAHRGATLGRWLA
ncbi:hypothetical protein [Streptomyces roseochromogenus]|uniref:Uncharacterized protein n=1 Tax=Streptomyces roseochromogenus subsp. oscitans DS 12.976 TaxID=1352936 RepID=V6KZ70_STRRC|nr:hypothetical protein [Streptomyces roseochromogenus]EST34274.1 hypothetical protein M878_10995 [Streptomyces roseochromogenus subsp. oscitans DS 12.976]